MRLALALLLNAGLLALLLPWLRREWRTVPARWWRGALVVGLGLRLLIGGSNSWHLVKDAAYMSQIARLLTAQLWAAPGAALHSFLGNELHFAGQDVVYYGMSNTYFFIKLLALLNLFSLGVDWVNGVYLSLLCFVGCWAAARSLARALPATPPLAGVVAFVFWPSVLWWASGVTKETALLGSGAGVLAVFIRLFYDEAPLRKWHRLGLFTALLGLAVVHFKMRYFFAAPLLAMLAGLAAVRGLQLLGLARQRWLQALLMAGCLMLGARLASEVSVAFRPNKFTNQLALIYARHLRASVDKPHFEYPDLRPTTESIASHAPQAIANSLTRPWLGESVRPHYVAAGLENAALLALLAVALAALLRGRGGQLPFALGLALALHCLILALLLGISTPNLGSLARYRSDLLPFLLLLLLQNDFARAGLAELVHRSRR